jgi:CheY-like chemotaxis protein
MEITDLLAPKTQEKGIELLVSFAPDLPRYVTGDPTRLRQILLNLTGNAIKFTEEGHVLIKVNWREEPDKRIRFYFEIEDTGMGIPSDRLSHIFEKFSQAEESTTRRFGGTGLGLTSCSKLVNMMEGAIYVASEQGMGSVFSFNIILRPAARTTVIHSQIPDSDLTGLRVLVVDDLQINREILYQSMIAWNMRCDTCATADKALLLMQEAASQNDPYHFAFLDYRIEGTNGMQLAEWIKTSPISLDATLFMVTALGQVITSMNLLEHGFSGFFVKPFSPDHLKAALQLLWDARKTGKKLPLVTRHMVASMLRARNREDLAALDSFTGTRVLVVEDMKVNLMLIVKILQKRGCEVSIAMNGKEAVEEMRKNSYDIVFMDCQMPEMDGFEATKTIRKEEGERGHTIIVALTADAMIGDREKCLRAGMDDYLNKPLRSEQITEILQKWTRKDAANPPRANS